MSEESKTLDSMVEYAMLFDFYGALLKDKNAEIFEDYMFNDMSLSEIASLHDMTRQGVRDAVLRSKDKLAGFEKKLGLVDRFKTIKSNVGKIVEATDELKRITGSDNGSGMIETKELNDYFDGMTDTILEKI